MGFIEAIQSAHAQTFRFSGRSSRSEFWWLQLYGTLGIFFFVLTFILLEASIYEGLGLFVTVIFGLYLFWLVVIQLSLITRRFHDIGHSGWWTLAFILIVQLTGLLSPPAGLGPEPAYGVFISLIPFLFFIPLLLPSNPHTNKYGSSPFSVEESKSDNTPLSQQVAEPPVTNSEPVSVTQEPIATNPVIQVKASQEHFAEALKEIENNEKKDGLWAMAYANTPSEEEAKKHYINLRAEELLQAEELAKAEAVKLAKEERKRKADEADRLAKEEHKRKADEAQRRLKQHRIEVAKIPDLISWATRHSYIVESKPGSYRIRKEPFGKFQSFSSDLDFLKHLTKLKEGSD